jgi:putative ABC transport system permease protein
MLHDLRYAARMLRRSPGFTVLAVAALALGIGANCAIFSLVRALLLAPLPYADAAHLYEIASTDPRQAASLADFKALKEGSSSFARLAVDRFWSFTLTDRSGDAERIYGRALSDDMMPLLGVQPQLGRAFQPDDYRPGAPKVVLLSNRLWLRRYSGDPRVVGRTLQLDGESHTIVGVMPAQFQFPVSVYGVWTPWAFSGAELAARRDRGGIIYARLRAGVTVAQAQAELDAFAHGIAARFSDTEKDWHPRIGPTKLGSSDQYRTGLLTLLAAVGFVLLIACLNVANLLLARAAVRKREIAVRIALGAGRSRIIRQLLTESLLLAALGAALGVLFASWGAKALMTSFPVHAPLAPLEYRGFDGTLFGFALIAALIASIVFGLVPALQLSRTNLNRELRGPRRFGSRQLLIVAETALSLVLLIGAGLMIRSFARLTDVDPGFRAQQVLTVQVPMPSFLSGITSFASRKEVETRQAAEYGDLIDHIRTLPGVIAAGVATALPLGPVEVHTQIGFEGDPNPQQDHGAQLCVVSPDFFRALGIPLLAGRAFSTADTAGAPEVAIVNDVVAHRYWPNDTPIGKHVNMSGAPSGPWYEVVGVVAAIHHRKLSDQLQPELYRPYQQYLGPAFGAVIAVRTVQNATALGPLVRGQIRTFYPSQPIGDIKPMQDLVAETVAQPRFYAALLATFATLALVLAIAGIYAVMSYSVAQRAREFGIRIALGATSGKVLGLVLRDGLAMVMLGIVLGVAGAAALTRLIRSELYETTPTEPAVFVCVSLVLLAAAAAAGYFPASRAAGVDPMVALRDE